MLEENIAIYDEEEGEFLSKKNLKLSQVEEEAVMDQDYFPNSHIQVLFQDPFADLLETFEEGVKCVKSNLMQVLKRSLGTIVQKQVRWEWPFYLSSTLKELNQDPSWNHLLDWLYWKREFTN